MRAFARSLKKGKNNTLCHVMRKVKSSSNKHSQKQNKGQGVDVKVILGSLEIQELEEVLEIGLKLKQPLRILVIFVKKKKLKYFVSLI